MAVYDQLESTDPKSIQTIFDYQARGQAAESTKQSQKAIAFYSKAYELAEPNEKVNWALYIADRQKDSKEKNRWQSLAYQQTPPEEQLSLAQKLANQAAEKKDWPNEKFWLAKLDKGGNSEVEMQAMWRQVEQAKTEKNSKAELEALQKILMRKPDEKVHGLRLRTIDWVNCTFNPSGIKMQLNHFYWSPRPILPKTIVN